MKADITNKLLQDIKPSDKPYEIRDQRLKGFMVRVNTSGKLMYMCQFGRGKRVTVGKVGVITLAGAREQARKILADAVSGIDPRKVRKLENQEATEVMTLNKFITQTYEPWLQAQTRLSDDTVDRIRSNFCNTFGDIPLSDITLLMVEEWRNQRLKKVKAATINRDTIALKAALNRAIKWDLLKESPLARLEPLKVQHDPIVRYLKSEEEQNLRNALIQRDEELKAARARTNEHRRTRELPVLPELKGAFADYLHPMVLLSMNTGIRRGELFNLHWEDISLDRAILIAKTNKSKKHTYKARHVPLNTEALQIMKAWYDQCDNKRGYVFLNKETNKPFTTIKKVWNTLCKDAKLESFRWHDFRHHFASRLVMVGIDLNTVRELLGHADIQMTLRYAYLAPEHKANAVEKLVR